VNVDDDGPVRTLTLSRPEALNAFTAEGFQELADRVRDADSDPAVSVVVLTGTGRAFTVGADRENWEPERVASVRETFTAAVMAIAELSKPLIVAVNGYAIGFGATVLGLADVVVISDAARVRTPFAELGTVAEGGSSVTFPALLGHQRAFWMLASGPWLSAAECVSYGLALMACPARELSEITVALARSLARAHPAVLQATKRLMTAGRTEEVRSALENELAEALFLQHGTAEDGV
jgi:enoyl-CoA hydratase/carnithine racemase